MESINKFKSVTVEVDVNANLDKVWEFWNTPKHITKWYYASNDWHSPAAENNPVKGGKFRIRMESFDGKMGFDFEGVYDEIIENKLIEYSLADGRKVKIRFTENNGITHISETFDLENENPEEMQRQGWQNILNNFKKYAQSIDKMVPLNFSIEIDAGADVVYKNLIGAESYKEWTKIFNETSHYIGSWEKGSKILFVGTDDKGNKGGMVSFIAENIPDKFISIAHRGILKGDEEIMDGPEVETWAGVYENYTLTPGNGKTKFNAYIDSNMEFKDYFSETYPKALDVLKKLCEK